MRQPQRKAVTIDDRYAIWDTIAGPYTVSETVLHPGRATRGHNHERDEVYYFVAGRGTMVVGEDSFDVVPGVVVYVGPDEYHRVDNTLAATELRFVSFFVGEAGRPEVTDDGQR